MSCDIFLRRYASSTGVLTSGLDIVFFEQSSCDGVIKLFDPKQTSFISDVQAWFGSMPSAMFLPFNLPIVELVFADNTIQFVSGPVFITPLNNLKSLNVVQMLDWETQVLLPGCLGLQEWFVNSNKMLDISPQTTFCDDFMIQYCAKADHVSDKPCACFADISTVQDMSDLTGINYPVNCFGSNCVSLGGYQTYAMMSTPCSVTSCVQSLSVNASNASSTSNLEQTTHCTGSYFETLNLNSSSQMTTAPTPGSSTQSVFSLVLQIGFTVVLFVIVLLVFFPKMSKLG